MGNMKITVIVDGYKAHTYTVPIHILLRKIAIRINKSRVVTLNNIKVATLLFIGFII